MKSKSEFHKAFFEALTQIGYEVKKSTSTDYLADIYKKGQIVAFYTKVDKIEKNPFSDVSERLADEINDLARSIALRCGISTEKPYSEKNEKLPNGAYRLCSFNSVELACKYHPLFDYVFSTYRISPENGKPVQSHHFYDLDSAKEDFTLRAGLIDARKLFNETELTIIHSELVKFMITPNDKTVDEFQLIGNTVERIEELVPELKDRMITFDYEHEFGVDDALTPDELELEA